MTTQSEYIFCATIFRDEFGKKVCARRKGHDGDCATYMDAGEPAAAAPPLACEFFNPTSERNECGDCGKPLIDHEGMVVTETMTKAEYDRRYVTIPPIPAPRTPSGNTCTQNGDEGAAREWRVTKGYRDVLHVAPVFTDDVSWMDEKDVDRLLAAYDQHRNRKLLARIAELEAERG